MSLDLQQPLSEQKYSKKIFFIPLIIFFGVPLALWLLMHILGEVAVLFWAVHIYIIIPSFWFFGLIYTLMSMFLDKKGTPKSDYYLALGTYVVVLIFVLLKYKDIFDFGM